MTGGRQRVTVGKSTGLPPDGILHLSEPVLSLVKNLLPVL